MFQTRWNLFRLLGIPIRVNPSWLVILALLTWTLATQFHFQLPEAPRPTLWLLGLLTALSFFVCIVLHELGHAVVARRLGMPINGITLFLFGGVAEMEEEPATPLREFLMAIAGPAVSAVLAAVFGALFWLGIAQGWTKAVQLVFENLALINVGVLIFNLVPAFPLDGGRVLRSILWGISGNLRRATRGASLAGQGFAWFLIGVGVLEVFAGQLLPGMWLGLIGLFLNNAARSSYESVLVRQVLTGEPVSRFMTRDLIVVPPWLNLREWVEEYVYRHHRKMFPVIAEGRLAGVVSTHDLAEFPRDHWNEHTVAEAMHGDVSARSIPPHMDALHALARMRSTGFSRLLVVEDGQLVGIVSLKDLLRFLDLKLQLEGPDDAPRHPPRSAAPREMAQPPV